MRERSIGGPRRGGALLIAFAAALVAALLSASPAAAQKRLGTLTLQPCGDVPRWLCGTLPRPLDPAKPGGRQIDIAFRWLAPRRAGGGHPALVAVEGGPGYPSTGSYVEFTSIYGRLLRDRGLLLVDNRGTGGSALIDCKRVQSYSGVTFGPKLARVVAGCARTIERKYGSADLFATAYATRDMAAVIRALRLGRVDLFGDSYGTFFVQSFISRYPRMLHSVLLDSSYPVRDLDPWYVSSMTVGRAALDAVCARDPGCAAAAPGSATARLAQLLERLRRQPISGRTRDADGSPLRVRFGVREIADMVQDAGSEPIIYRELDAAVRAALAGDKAPLVRLVGQSRSYLHSSGGDSTYYSDGLYWAVACLDYPQLFSMRSSPKRRRAQLAARLLAPPPGAFDPFTAREWVTIDNYSQPYSGCLDWPRPRHEAPLVPPDAAPLPASVPLLVIGGDLDSLTPFSDAKVFGPTLGANVRVVELPNTTHVTSQGFTPLLVGTRCTRKIIRRFVVAPERMATLDAGCASSIPHVHTPGSYPRRLAGAAPAEVTFGPDPGLDARRAVTVAANALADAPIRQFYSGARRGPGLRGGTFTARGTRVLRLRLRRIRFVTDAFVSGTGTWRPADGAARGTLSVTLPDDDVVRVELRWSQRSLTARARVGASILTLPAP